MTRLLVYQKYASSVVVYFVSYIAFFDDCVDNSIFLWVFLSVSFLQTMTILEKMKSKFYKDSVNKKKKVHNLLHPCNK